MAQAKHFMFGIDNVSFIDSEYEVFGIKDPQSFMLNMTYETTVHRGGANNDVRQAAVHSRSAEITLGTGYVDAELARLLTGGTITSLGTSAASVTTGTANGVNTLFGTTATLPTGVTTIEFNSPTLAKTTDYYIKATDTNEVVVTRVEDGKVFDAVTTANTTNLDLDPDRGIIFQGNASATSLTANEKAIVSVRAAINSINQKLTLDSVKPEKLSMRATVDYNGYRRVINVPVSQPTGSVFGESATEFQVQDLTFPVEFDCVLDELMDMTLQA